MINDKEQPVFLVSFQGKGNAMTTNNKQALLTIQQVGLFMQ